MRNWIDLIETAAMKIERASFRLHPLLDPKKYVMTDSFAGIETWRAYTYEANSGGTVGAMDDVGYVMISVKDDTIIPIARGDEHHTGYDLLYEMQGIEPEDYVPLFNGNNYILHKEDIPDHLIAIKKWLSYGGNNGPLKGTNEIPRTVMTLRDFIERNGNMEIVKGQLSPMGQAMFDRLSAIAAALGRARNSSLGSDKGKAFEAAKAFVRFISPMNYEINRIGDFEDNFEAKWKQQISTFTKAGDVQGLEMMFFGPTGNKNTMHNKLREYAQLHKDSGGGRYIIDDVPVFWGDVELAIAMLGDF